MPASRGRSDSELTCGIAQLVNTCPWVKSREVTHLYCPVDGELVCAMQFFEPWLRSKELLVDEIVVNDVDLAWISFEARPQIVQHFRKHIFRKGIEEV